MKNAVYILQEIEIFLSLVIKLCKALQLVCVCVCASCVCIKGLLFVLMSLNLE